MNYDVFISYSRKDTEVAEKICSALDKYGIVAFPIILVSMPKLKMQ